VSLKAPEVSTVRGDQSVEELKRELAEARDQQAAMPFQEQQVATYETAVD